MSRILIAITAFNEPWTVRAQLRLLAQNLRDDHRVFLIDNSTDPVATSELSDLAHDAGAVHIVPRSETHEHPEALNYASGLFRQLDVPDGHLFEEENRNVTHLLWLDHDIYLTAPLELCPLIDRGGFLAVRQRHPATGVHYPWPGFLAVSRGWLNGRALNFDGIRGVEKRDDGDAGSMLWTVFDSADWTRLPLADHGYRELRPADDAGLQSFAYEYFRFAETAEWRHAMNVSGWLAVPDPEGRERLVREMVAAL